MTDLDLQHLSELCDSLDNQARCAEREIQVMDYPSYTTAQRAQCNALRQLIAAHKKCSREAEIVAIRRIPVLTNISPDWARVPLGMVHTECVADTWAEAMPILQAGLEAAALQRFGAAAHVCHNFTYEYEAGSNIWSGRRYMATADVYGEEIDE